MTLTLCNNYWPISLFSNTSKISEKFFMLHYQYFCKKATFSMRNNLNNRKNLATFQSWKICLWSIFRLPKGRWHSKSWCPFKETLVIWNTSNKWFRSFLGVKKQHTKINKSTIIFIIFLDFLMFHQIFLSP